MKTIESQVVIIGAGMAGLAAAQVLGKRGVSCTLLEAAPHVGGRIRTLWREGWPLPIELGAEFVHGLPAPTLALGKMRVQLQEVPDVRLQMGGSVVRMPAVWARYAQLLKPALRDADLAQSVCDYMATPEFDDKQREFVRLLVEGYHAAPLADTSAAAVARDAAALGADFKQYRLERGQQQLVELVLEQLRLSSPRVELNTRVQRVQWTKN